jgi:carbamoyl-phosphate synthase large subunit
VGRRARRPAVIFRADTGDLFTVNAPGEFIWRLLADGRSPETVARRLAKRYGLSPARAIEDVYALLAQTRRHGSNVRDSNVGGGLRPSSDRFPRIRSLRRIPDRTRDTAWSAVGHDRHVPRRQHARGLVVAVTGLAAAENPAPGVAVARSLRAARDFRGRVLGLTFDPRLTGVYSSHFDAVHAIPPPAQGGAAFLDALRAIVHAEGVDVVVPTLDPEALLCAAAVTGRARLGARMLLPRAGAIRRRAKMVLPALARRVGFHAPRTMVVTSIAALAAASHELGLPLMLKGSLADSRLVTSMEEAGREFQRLATRWGFPLLAQEFIIGDELDLAALYDRAGRRVGAVPMRKLGVTSQGKAWAGVTVEAPDLVGLGDRLMHALGWIGAAEIEVICERASGALYLIEVNPRFPAWIHLTAAAGVNLPWALVCLATGQQVAPLPPAPPGVLFARTIEDHVLPLIQATTLLGPSPVAGESRR